MFNCWLNLFYLTAEDDIRALKRELKISQEWILSVRGSILDMGCLSCFNTSLWRTQTISKFKYNSPEKYYSTMLTEPEVNNCFSICTRSDLNRIRKETMKKTISLIHGWIHEWTCSRKQQMHNSWIFTVFLNMANHSFNCFVNFSINDWKENVESLKNSPFWEETKSFICFCQLTVNETVFLSLLANAVNSGYDRGERCLSAVQCSLPC